MKGYIKKIKQRYIDNDNYSVSKELPDNLSLRDKFIMWTINNKINVIKLHDMTKAVILYYPINHNKIKNIISLVVNPITLHTCAYMGKISIVDVDEETGNFMLELNDRTFSMGDNSTYLNGKNELELHIIDCKIMILRDIFMFEPDPIYVTITKSLTDIFPLSYYTNSTDHENNTLYESYHPKTLIYAIKYKSTSGKYKVTLLVGAGANSNEPAGMGYKRSKFDDYIRVYADKLSDKHSYIFPIYWYSANKLFKKYNIVTL